VAFDGDGDRAIFVDHRGRIVDGDAVLLMLGLHYQRHARGSPATRGRDRDEQHRPRARAKREACAHPDAGRRQVRDGGDARRLRARRRAVRARHLCRAPSDGRRHGDRARGAARDGRERRELADLAAELVTYPQTLTNVRVREKRRSTRCRNSRAIARVDAALDGRGRVLVRYSGTEPLLRIMIEGPGSGVVQAWAEEIADAVRSTLA
jgi:phosphoglucosamine mutase